MAHLNLLALALCSTRDIEQAAQIAAGENFGSGSEYMIEFIIDHFP
jgi:hypothetical protein